MLHTKKDGVVVRRYSARSNKEKEFDIRYGYQTPRKVDVLAALQQLIENAVDNGCTFIWILINASQKLFRVVNNGRGFETNDFHGFYWLNTSMKAGQEGQIGQHGTGRTRATRFSELLAHSMSKDAMQGVRTHLTREILKEIYLEKRKEGGDWTFGVLPDWWGDFFAPSTYGTAIDLILKDEDWKRMPKETEVIEKLGQRLKPSVQQKVKVGLTKEQLKPRILAKGTTPFHRLFGQDFLGKELFRKFGGPVEVELYIPQHKIEGETVRLGAANPIAPLRLFTDKLSNEHQAGLIPELLRGDLVVGDIFFPALNDHCAEDRESFKDSLYDGLHADFIHFLSDMLEPLIQEAFSRHQEEAVKRRSELMNAKLAQSINAATGFDPTTVEDDGGGVDDLPPGKKKKRVKVELPAIVLSRRYIHPTVGDTQEVEALRHEGIDVADLEWMVVQADCNDFAHIMDDELETKVGELSVFRGAQTIFTPNKVGSCKVVCRNAQNHGEFAVVAVEVQGGKHLHISPNGDPVKQGSRKRFRVMNADKGSGQFRWELETRKGMRLLNKKGLQTYVEVDNDCLLGSYRIFLIDEQDEKLRVEARFHVEERASMREKIRIENAVYFLEPAVPPHPPLVNIIPAAKGVFNPDDDGPRKVGKVQVNYDHEDLSSLRSDEMRFLVIYQAISLEHLRVTRNNPRIAEAKEDHWRILSAYLAGRKK